MKTKSILFSLLFAGASLAFMTNCSGGKKHEDAEAHEGHDAHEGDGHEHAAGSGAEMAAVAPQFQVDAKFQEQLGAVYASYIKMKDALVESDPAKVKTTATEAKSALGTVDMKLLSGAAHNDWMTYLSPIEASIKEIEASSDIEVQRKSFSTLSDNLYKSVKAFGLGGKETFYEYCPMAFNNEGAYWLSDQSEIRNPYFGDKMLKCGVVKEKLK